MNISSRKFIWFIIRSLFLAILCVPALVSPSWGIVYIDINSPSGVRIPVAVPDLLAENREAAEFALNIPSVIASDLGISSIFDLINKDAYLETIREKSFDEGGISFSDWKMIGADSLVMGKVRVEGNYLRVEMRLYDIATGELLTGRKYTGPKKRFDMIAHKFANEILYQYTGVMGVFDTEIAFSARKGRGKEIFLVDLAGKKLRQVTHNGSINMFPRWSPGGYKIAYLSYKKRKPFVYLRSFLTGRDRILLRYGGFKSPGAFSPRGDSLYLSLSVKGNVNIYRYLLEEEELKRVVANYGIDVSPTLSPDGRSIAFVSDRSGYPQIYVKELPAGKERRVSFAGYYSTSPTWSPSGGKIAFTSMEKGKFSIYTVNPDGSGMKEIVSADGSCEDPSFSPDGRYIVYIYRKKGYSEMRIVNVTGYYDRLIFKGLDDLSSPSWSPRR